MVSHTHTLSGVVTRYRQPRRLMIQLSPMMVYNHNNILSYNIDNEGLKRRNGTPKHKSSSDSSRPPKPTVKSSETPQKSKSKSKSDVKKPSPPKPKPRVRHFISLYLLYFCVFTFVASDIR